MKTITLLNKKKIILIGFLLLVTLGYSQTTQTFTSSGVFVAPAGVTTVQVQAWGAGGAGGGNSTTTDGAGGGGGGAYSINPALIIAPGNHTVTVGVGGTGVAGGIGGNGEDSWFSTAATVMAKGGNGGNPPVSGAGGIGGAGGLGSASIGTIKYNGGTGGYGRDANTGHGGPGATSAGTLSNGLSGANPWNSGTGINAPTPVPVGAGAGANGGSATNNGSDNTAPPGGGGGGAGDKSSSGSPSTIGGNGADGQVIVSWTCPTYALTTAATNNGPFCNASAATVTLRSTTLPSGTYTVTYNLSGATSATGNTATMTFTAGSPGTGTFTTTSLNVGATTVTITNLSSGAGCSTSIVSFNTTTVNITAPATAVAGSNISGCSTSTSFNITSGASATNYTSVLWTSSGTGTFTNANSLTLCTYTPSAMDIAGGTVTITLNATGNAPCGVVTSSKFLTIYEKPTAVAGSNVSTCSSDGAVNITFGSSASNHSSVTWTSSGTGTFANPNSLSNCTYTPSAADIAAGSVTLTLTAYSLVCSLVTSTKTLTILSSPTITSTTPASRIGSGTVTLAATASSGTISWYASATGGGSLGTGNSFTTPVLFTTTTYYVQSFNGSCNSAPRVAVTATVFINEIDVQGNATSIVDGDITPTAADWTDFGTASTRTFTIRNTGSSTLGVGAISISGANAADFSVTTAPSATVGASSSTTFVVTFTPSAVGVRTASISIANNDLDENPYDFSIQGTGLAQEINIQGNSTSIVDGDVTPTAADWTDFGTTVAVSGSLTRTFTIQNTGAVSLTIGAISFSGTNPTDFSVTTPPAATVAGYGSTTFVVTFVPGAGGVRSASMSIVNNDSNENPYDFTLQGTGTEPEMDVLGNAVSIVDGDITPTVADWTDFGTTDINTGSITRTFTINNTGAATLTIGAITFSGTNPGDFTVTTTPSATVASGASTTLVVTFDPTAVGVRTAMMNIANTDLNENPYNFTLQGTGTAQEMDVLGNATSIVDGDTTPTTADWTDFSNLTTTRTFTINNTGTSPLTIGAITFSGANAADFSISTPPAAIIIAGSSSTFTVLYTPVGIGTSNATISIVNNDSDENPYDFSIRGTAINNEIDIQGNGVSIVDGDNSPTTADWTDFSTTATSRTFTIFNTGATALTIGAITFSGTNPGDFSITTPPSASVAGYSSTTFVVRFAPAAVGTRSAIMSIVNNDANENPYDFTLQGTGVAQEIDIQGNGSSIATGDMSPSTSDWTDFSNVAITRTFTIRNTGTMNLTIGAITITGANPGDFSISTAPSPIVAGTTTSTFVVTFAPTVIGVRTATINIPNNDTTGGENPYTFGISATSTSEIAVSGLFTNIVDGDSSPSQDDWTDFGTVSIENGNVLANYVITNSGTGPLVIGAITIAGANASDFTITGAPAASVASGASTILQISFNPTVLGVKTATVSIANNDIDENPFNFSITATGVRTYINTDGDAVTDNFDLDDDNDGIVDTLEQSSCLASPFASAITQTFLNETFGSGKTKGLININIPGASTTSCYEDGIAGNANNCGTNASIRLDDGEYCVNYYISHNSNAAYPESVHQSLAWTDQLDHTPADTNGRMAIYNADNTAGTYFYQVLINGVLPNAPISFGFWVMNIMRQGNLAGSIKPNITIEFRDVTGATLYTSYNTGDIGRCSATDPLDNTCGPSLSNWLNYTTTVNLGNVTDFMVKIRNNAPGGGGNDFAMDDILITQTYCDWDADGIANLFDLDSDNDGIADIEEGGFKQYSAGLSRMDLSGTWTDANLNGMNDVIDPIYTGVNNSVPDTDGDGARDAIDLDSDNDSLFDVDEAIANMGDGDINGDGKGDGVDTDRDGILDIYDTLSGFGTAVRPYTQNTDGIGNPDYLQVDSNNDGITDIAGSLYASLDANNDGKIDGTADVDKDGIIDAFDTNTALLGSPRDLNRKLFLDFDGRNDYGQDATALGVLTNTSMMAWVDLNSAFSATGVIAGTPNFQLRINSSRNLEAIVNGTTVAYTTTALNTSQWYHVGAVYNGATVKLYLNGVMVNSGAATGSIASSVLTLGKNPSAANTYFKGKIDELRVFNTALTDSQFQRMVYQEIQNNGTEVRGAIVPKDVGSLAYSNVLRYYRMDAYKDDIVDNLITPSIDSGTGMKIYNHKVIKVQEAPMPFVTKTTGTFATAVNDASKDIRGLDVTDYDYSIIQVKHNITETANSTDLAMFVDPGVTITMNNDTKIQNDWYLKLDGKIDLQGKSQLVQSANSELDATSAGSIERDQQGQSNKFNYNYWSSPVGGLSATTNNNAFTVNGVLRDGTDPNNIQNITWTTGYNGAATSPITLSSYWIFKFQNLTPQYANWAAVGQNGSLNAAQGFTMKGSSAATATQNYTFVGKPNNGTITVPIAGGNLNLCGNPYASAIDADAFIAANTASTTGAIYFWEHYNTNTSHNLIEYQGGYAARNLVGGTPPVAPAGISGAGSSSRIPARFIPVGQGFLVYGSGTGGNITFDNNQRAFVKETDVTSNVMFRQNNAASIVDSRFDNREDRVAENNTNFSKIRLGFDAVNGAHRQILLGFMNEFATEGFDSGYDAPQLDIQPNDFYFAIPGQNLVIQGVDAFSDSKILPLSVKNGAEGNVKFTLDDTENLDANQNIYIHDNVTDEYHDIRSNNFEINLPVGNYDTRFSLRFTNSALGTNDFELGKEVIVSYTNNDDMINISNTMSDATIKTVELYNMLGQSIKSWDVKNADQTKIKIPVVNVSTGAYIVKVLTTKGDLSKKIIIE